MAMLQNDKNQGQRPPRDGDRDNAATERARRASLLSERAQLPHWGSLKVPVFGGYTVPITRLSLAASTTSLVTVLRSLICRTRSI